MTSIEKSITEDNDFLNLFYDQKIFYISKSTVYFFADLKVKLSCFRC